MPLWFWKVQSEMFSSQITIFDADAEASVTAVLWGLWLLAFLLWWWSYFNDLDQHRGLAFVVNFINVNSSYLQPQHWGGWDRWMALRSRPDCKYPTCVGLGSSILSQQEAQVWTRKASQRSSQCLELCLQHFLPPDDGHYRSYDN